MRTIFTYPFKIMSLSHRLSVFTHAARLGFKEVFAEPILLFGSFLTYAALVVAYSNVFRGIPAEDLAAHQLTVQDLMWYFSVTEFLLFCSSFTHFKELQFEIQNDHIQLALLRPCPLWVVRIGEWSGQSVARFLALLVPCFALTTFMSDSLRFDLPRFIGFVSCLPLSILVLVCSFFFVGSLSLWLKQAEPAFWVWQKFLFFFGALLWPLVFYPPLLQKIAWGLPFASILIVPAQWMLPENTWSILGGFVHQIVWSLLALGAVAFITRAMLRHMQRSG